MDWGSACHAAAGVGVCTRRAGCGGRTLLLAKKCNALEDGARKGRAWWVGDGRARIRCNSGSPGAVVGELGRLAGDIDIGWALGAKRPGGVGKDEEGTQRTYLLGLGPTANGACFAAPGRTSGGERGRCEAREWRSRAHGDALLNDRGVCGGCA